MYTFYAACSFFDTVKGMVRNTVTCMVRITGKCTIRWSLQLRAECSNYIYIYQLYVCVEGAMTMYFSCVLKNTVKSTIVGILRIRFRGTIRGMVRLTFKGTVRAMVRITVKGMLRITAKSMLGINGKCTVGCMVIIPVNGTVTHSYSYPLCAPVTSPLTGLPTEVASSHSLPVHRPIGHSVFK